MALRRAGRARWGTGGRSIRDVVTVPSIQMRRRLVAHLRRSGYVHERRVMEAFLTVPREVFLPELLAKSGLTAVYRDEAIVTRRDEASHAPLSSSSQPAIMALMLEMLDVRPGHRVVEIGAGTGYNAAILAVLAGAFGLVVSLDIDGATATAAARALRSIDSRVRVLVADGTQGLPGMAQGRHRADRWMVTASTTAVPRAWYDQIAHGGRLVVPLRLTDEPDQLHAVSALVKVDDGFDSIAVTPGGFMPLRCTDGTAFDPMAPASVPPARELRSAPPAAAGPASEPDPAEAELVPAELGPTAAAPAEAVRPRRRARGSARTARVRPPGPLRSASREQMESVRIVVRYTGGEPASRWTFDHGDHWIGVDPER
jgi:protein-L-isoaspartate(D-aspartate) O-methyltransferase